MVSCWGSTEGTGVTSSGLSPSHWETSDQFLNPCVLMFSFICWTWDCPYLTVLLRGRGKVMLLTRNTGFVTIIITDKYRKCGSDQK